jgi:hypothetical protein
MSLLSWLRTPKDRTAESKDEPVEGEKKALRAELAQTVVTFERKRFRVHQIAAQALQRMRDE